MTIEEAEALGLKYGDARKLAFITAPDLAAALDVAWRGHEDISQSKAYYYHYTTLPKLMSNILSGKWYLSGSTSQRMNDQQEIMKYGDEKVAKRSYQLSMGKGTRESAAFWGLYGRNNPFAIKALIPAAQIDMWVRDLKKEFEEVEFKDIVYTSIPLAEKRHWDKHRGCHLFWDGVTCTFGENKEVKEALPRQLKEAKYTGWFKDVEWMHENETRLCVRCRDSKAKAICVPYPPELVEKMSFTLSPWADEEMAKQIRSSLESCLKVDQGRFEGKVKFRSMGERFHISTVTGALNFTKEDPKQCGNERCQFGVLRSSAAVKH